MEEELKDEMISLLDLKRHYNPVRAVAGIVQSSDHYFVVVLDVLLRSAHIFGGDPNSQDNAWDHRLRRFKRWHGDRLWDWVIDLFGWGSWAERVTSVGLSDWLQVRFDYVESKPPAKRSSERL